jgi:hypothetical protein
MKQHPHTTWEGECESVGFASSAPTVVTHLVGRVIKNMVSAGFETIVGSTHFYTVRLYIADFYLSTLYYLTA